MPMNASKSLAFVSLGCPKNLVDTERMLGKLAQDGYALVPEIEGADVVVVNTCGFIESARQESMATIQEMLNLKKEGKVGAVVVAGCLVERQREELLTTLPDVDRMIGVFAREEIVQVTNQANPYHSIPALASTTVATNTVSIPITNRTKSDDASLNDSSSDLSTDSLGIAELPINKMIQEQRQLFRPAPVTALEDTARLRITPKHYAYLKISEGCDRLCTFCAIPKMRGKHVTKPIEEVIREAKELAQDGVRELIIVAQDSTYYGMDLYGKVRLAELLRELSQIDGIEWIRLLYAYPEHITAELLQTLAQTPKLLPYIDMPLQHINNRMLKRMQRRVDRNEIESLIGQLRTAIPNLVFRTTFIVGFPGETDEEFAELADFIQQQKFERLGVFTYSFEPGTPATKLDGHLPEEVKEHRRDELMKLQQPIAFSFAQSQIGKELELIIDGPDPEFPQYLSARSYADSPEIDTLIRVKGKKLRSGDLVKGKITSADGYDLIAKTIGQVR